MNALHQSQSQTHDASLHVYDAMPEELASTGYTGCTDSLFKRLHRPWTWRDGKPVVSGRLSHLFPEHSCRLPTIVNAVPSADGSKKCIFQTHDGHLFEAMHMPRAVRHPRVTFCVSSQVGCAMACGFCATGKMNLKRNLRPEEIVGQVLMMMHTFGPTSGAQINLVFMGMGEPLHNKGHVQRAIELLCHPSGLGLSENRISVSTCGLVPQIREMATWPRRPLLAISLNGTTDEQRSAVMPINRKYPLDLLRETLCQWPFRAREKITVEYVLMAGQNDGEADALRLARFVKDFPHLVNLIPMNQHANSPYQSPSPTQIDLFAGWLAKDKVRTVVRQNRGRDISGACGQLIQMPRSETLISC